MFEMLYDMPYWAVLSISAVVMFVIVFVATYLYTSYDIRNQSSESIAKPLITFTCILTFSMIVANFIYIPAECKARDIILQKSIEQAEKEGVKFITDKSDIKLKSKPGDGVLNIKRTDKFKLEKNNKFYTARFVYDEEKSKFTIIPLEE